MVFLEMGGEIANLEVKLLDSHKNAPQRKRRSSLANALDTFDPTKAKCFTDYDTQRLQAIMEITGHERIAQLVRDVFVANA